MNNNNINHKSDYFLATTALEEFWDTSKQLLFLGVWCRRYSRKSFWEPLPGKVLAGPWHDVRQLYKAYHYVADLYERVLPVLGEALNATHRVNHGARYWRILLGPWLLFYLPLIYDRHCCLRRALDDYPDVSSIVLAEEEWVTPGDCLEFIQLIKWDPYNLQLYSRILKILGYDFPQKTLSVEARPFSSQINLPGWKKRLDNFLVPNLARLGKICQPQHTIILRNSYFSPRAELQIFIKTRGMIRPVLGGLMETSHFQPNTSARLSLENVLAAKNDFEKLLNKMLALDVPQIFIEGFEALQHAAERIYPAKPKAIFSAGAWYFDEAFKQWAAVSAEKGARLLGMQHGGNYGSLAHHPSEDHEVTVVDRYFTWGWERTDHRAKVIPRYATKLAGRKPLPTDSKKTGILFAATMAARYLFQFPQSPEQFNQYVHWQSRFLAGVNRELLAQMRVRFHAEDFGWDLTQRWQDTYPEIRMETWETPFLQNLGTCRVFVCDHLATTFLEALSTDIPTILFWDPATNELRPEAQPYYDLLRAAGILYDTPEAAAHGLNVVYDDVVTWWNHPERQEARGIFCRRFARTSANAVNEWIKEFKRIANGDAGVICLREMEPYRNKSGDETRIRR